MGICKLGFGRTKSPLSLVAGEMFVMEFLGDRLLKWKTSIVPAIEELRKTEGKTNPPRVGIFLGTKAKF